MAAQIFEGTSIGDTVADMQVDGFLTDGSGEFNVDAMIPNMLRSAAAGTEFFVVPGDYVINVHTVAAPLAAVSVPFTVGAPRLGGSLIWGNIGFDLSGNAHSDNPDVAGAPALELGVGISATGPTADGQPINVVTDARGQYLMLVPAGTYQLSAGTGFGAAAWGTSIAVVAGASQSQNIPLLLEPGIF
jgi:hypothetical protein